MAREWPAFKNLTTDNCRIQDKVMVGFATVTNDDGTIHTASPEEWINGIFEPVLSGSVPPQVKQLFQIAQGALAYGYYFYPLYALGAEQLCRAVEVAFRRQPNELNSRASPTLQNKLPILTNRGILSDQQEWRWDLVRTAEDQASRPARKDKNSAVPKAIETVAYLAKEINSLFE